LLNPYQLPAHGLQSRCAATLSDCMPSIRLASKDEAFSFRSGARPHCSRKQSPGPGGRKCVNGRAKFTCANLDGLSGILHTWEIFCSRTPDFGASVK
jgi:hypothetical protein